MSSSPCFEVTLPGGKQPVHALPSASPAVRPSAVRVFRAVSARQQKKGVQRPKTEQCSKTKPFAIWGLYTHLAINDQPLNFCGVDI